MATVYRGRNPYKDIVPPQTDPSPWPPAAQVHEDLVIQVHARLIVEVGAGGGLPAMYLASLLRRQGEGVLFAVDTWLGTAEDWNSGPIDLQLANGYPQAYHRFLADVVHHGLARYVVPFPATSQTAARHLASRGVQADLVHLGAATTYADAAEEIGRWWPLARPCGVVCGEAGAAGQGALRSAEDFAGQEGLDLHREGGGWSLVKPGAACRVRPAMRLIINSNVRYSKPLGVLLKSLLKAKWTRWGDVVIFFGGSLQDLPPRKALHSWVPQGITVANLTLNNYDYTGLAGLYRFRKYPELHADAYMYTHDTTTVVPDFFSYFEKASRGFQRGEVRVPAFSSSNVFTFSSDMVSLYKENYDVNLTKAEAVALEIEGSHRSGSFNVRCVRHMGYFARTYIRSVPRISAGDDIDIYDLGHKRQRFFYPDFGIVKYLLHDMTGDVIGNVKSIWP